jgi:hypothetical protein
MWAPREYFFSQEVGTPVFLLRAKPIAPTLAIAGYPYIDFIADLARGYEKLERELKRKELRLIRARSRPTKGYQRTVASRARSFGCNPHCDLFAGERLPDSSDA